MCPGGDVAVDVAAGVVELVLAADDDVVEAGLPGEVRVDEFSDFFGAFAFELVEDRAK